MAYPKSPNLRHKPVIEQNNINGGKRPIAYVPSLFDKANMDRVKRMRFEIVD